MPHVTFPSLSSGSLFLLRVLIGFCLQCHFFGHHNIFFLVYTVCDDSYLLYFQGTSVPSPVDVSTPPLRSSPMNEPHEQLAPTRTKGEATASLQVGDNARKQNTDVFNAGKLSPLSDILHRDKSSSVDVHQSKKTSEKPQSPPNPFIFPSTFQGSAMDTEVRPSPGESLLKSSTNRTVFSESTQQNSNTKDSPREHVITQSDAQSKHNQRKQGVVSTIPDDDLRPEVAKLPGRTRVASWGAPQEEETAPLTNGPRKESQTGSGSHLYPNQQEHRFTNGDHADGIPRSSGSENAGRGNTSVVPTRVHLHNQLSDASSESSSPSESRRSSVSKNRKSWDGVRHPGESEENQKVSRLERPKDSKERSCSDSNLMVRNTQLSTFIIRYIFP